MNVHKVPAVTCEALANFQSKVEAKTAQVGIVGLGYVGSPLALLFARNGFAVTGLVVIATGHSTYDYPAICGTHV